jgi:hypothetical protein
MKLSLFSICQQSILMNNLCFHLFASQTYQPQSTRLDLIKQRTKMTISAKVTFIKKCKFKADLKIFIEVVRYLWNTG